MLDFLFILNETLDNQTFLFPKIDESSIVKNQDLIKKVTPYSIDRNDRYLSRTKKKLKQFVRVNRFVNDDEIPTNCIH